MIRHGLARPIAGLLGLLAGLALSACAAPTPVAVQDVTFQVTLDQTPVADALIYTLTGIYRSDSSGRLAAQLEDPDSAIALKSTALVTTTRPGHDWLAEQLKALAGSPHPPNWQYQVYLTSMQWDDTGAPLAAHADGSRLHALSLDRQRPLVLFNLLVSIEWDADRAYLDDFALALQRASTYLWDLTDGQMAIGQARIVDNRRHWWDADIRVLARNTETPHASIGGIEEQLQPENYRIQVGPYWDRSLSTRPNGRWSENDGFRTLVHELGHYALGLYDEYVGPNGSQHYCTSRQPAGDPDGAGASAMNWQYTTSELSSRDTPVLWASGCERTLQWTKTRAAGQAELAWQTTARRFSRPPDWQVTAPGAHALAGPISSTWPAALGGIPAVVVEDRASPAELLPPFTLTAESATGALAPARIWLENRAVGCAISLGEIDAAHPALRVLGGHVGDLIYAEREESISTWLCASLALSEPVSTTQPLTLTSHDFSCPFRFKQCPESHASRAAAEKQVMLARFDPAQAPASPADVVWELQPAGWASIPLGQQAAVAEAMGFDAAQQALFTASALQFLAEQSAANAAQIGGVLVCFEVLEGCLPLDIGIAAYPPSAQQAGEGEPGLGPLTLSSSDGRLQVYRQGSDAPDDLFILDSPLPAGLAAAGSREGASRLYTLGGDWGSADLLVQIQSECCATANAENRPRLFRVDRGDLSPQDDNWYYAEEGYVLAQIRAPGSYALLR